MAAAELAIDRNRERTSRPEAAPAPAEARPRLELVEPHRTWARPSLGFVYDGAPACRSLRAGLSRRHVSRAPLPMEDVVLYAKPIDNSQVRRPNDSRDVRLLRNAALWGFCLLVAIAATLGPRAWLRDTEAQVTELRKRESQLTEYRDHLRLRLAQHTDPRRVAAIAEAEGYTQPGPDRHFWQNPAAPEEALAGAPAARENAGGDSVSQP